MSDVVIIINRDGVREIRAAAISDTAFVRDIHSAIERFDAAIRRLERNAAKAAASAASGD